MRNNMPPLPDAWQIKNSTNSILVVDDDPDFLDLLCEELRNTCGARVERASNSQSALKKIRHEHFDLIVSDWDLKVDTASDILIIADVLRVEHYKSNNKTPVLFMSSSEKVGPTRSLRTLQNFEPVSFILKRFGPPLISLLAKNILRRFHPLRESKPYQ